jgi:transposase
VVAERRLPNDHGKIVGFLSPWREELAGIVVESTFNWYWLDDGLQGAGFTVHLANTTALQKYDARKHSGDEADARYLAHLLRLGILPTGTILAPEQRAVHDLARKRIQLVRSRTTHVLAVEKITARQHGAQRRRSTVDGQVDRYQFFRENGGPLASVERSRVTRLVLA